MPGGHGVARLKANHWSVSFRSGCMWNMPVQTQTLGLGMLSGAKGF